MSEVRQRVQQLRSQFSRKEPLWRKLDRELDYDGELPTNLSVPFMKACYGCIAPDEDPYTRLQVYHDNYSEQWVEKRTKKVHMATALKLLLCERVGRSEANVISGVTMELLAELIVAIRTADDPVEWERDRLDAAPEREPPCKSPFDDGLPFEKALTPALIDWLAERPADRSHGVYVLDCTPDIGDAEDSKIRALRGQVATERQATEPREKAACVLNNDGRVFYVGYASNVAERLHRHDRRPAGGGAKFTAMFPPQELGEVTWHSTKEAALEYERRRAHELSQPGEYYAYSEQK